MKGYLGTKLKYTKPLTHGMHMESLPYWRPSWYHGHSVSSRSLKSFFEYCHWFYSMKLVFAVNSDDPYADADLCIWSFMGPHMTSSTHECVVIQCWRARVIRHGLPIKPESQIIPPHRERIKTDVVNSRFEFCKMYDHHSHVPTPPRLIFERLKEYCELWHEHLVDSLIHRCGLVVTVIRVCLSPCLLTLAHGGDTNGFNLTHHLPTKLTCCVIVRSTRF